MNGNLTILTAEQVFIMFLLILTGFVSVRAGAVKPEARTALSDLLVNVIMPAMIINSYVAEFDPSILANLARALGASIVALGGSAVISALICMKSKDPDMPIMRFGMASCNCGYMGFPLITALFGSEGLLYGSMYNTIYNLLVWSVGVHSVERKKKNGGFKLFLDIIKNPSIIAVAVGLVIYLAQIPIPSVILTPIQFLGNMNTPVSMFITGMIMATGGVLKNIKEKRLWGTIAVRLLIIPALVLLFCRLVGLGGMVGAVVVLLTACPCGSLTSVFAVQYHYGESLAAGLVVISTLLSIFTLPLFAAFL